MIYGSRRERKHLESLSQYEMDQASAELIEISNYGMQQDLLNGNLSFLQNTLGSKSLFEDQSENFKNSQTTLMIVIGAGLLLLLLVIALAFKK